MHVRLPGNVKNLFQIAIRQISRYGKSISMRELDNGDLHGLKALLDLLPKYRELKSDRIKSGGAKSRLIAKNLQKPVRSNWLNVINQRWNSYVVSCLSQRRMRLLCGTRSQR